MPAYSARSLERTIGRYKRLINARTNVGVNAGNVVDRLALLRLVKSFAEEGADIDDEIQLLTPRKFSDNSYIKKKDDIGGSQLWAPITHCTVGEITIGDKNKFLAALVNFYDRSFTKEQLRNIVFDESMNISLAGSAWAYNKVYRSQYSRNHTGAKARGSHYVMVYAEYLK